MTAPVQNLQQKTLEAFSPKEEAIAQAIVRLRELFEAAPHLATSISQVPGALLVNFGDLKVIHDYAAGKFEEDSKPALSTGGAVLWQWRTRLAGSDQWLQWFTGEGDLQSYCDTYSRGIAAGRIETRALYVAPPASPDVRAATIEECAGVADIHAFGARQAVRSATGPKYRQAALAREETALSIVKAIRALTSGVEQ